MMIEITSKLTPIYNHGMILKAAYEPDGKLNLDQPKSGGKLFGPNRRA